MFYSAILGDAENYSKLKEETPEFEDLFFVIYFILTIFFIVIMLNLLIAIISGTFETVTKVESKAFQFERLNIIMEIEEMYKEDLIKKRKWENNYLYIIQHEENCGEEEGKILKNIKYSVEDQSNTLNEINDKISALGEKLTKGINELNEKITKDLSEKMRKEIDDKLQIFNEHIKNLDSKNTKSVPMNQMIGLKEKIN